MMRKWLISLTPGENEYEDVIVNGPFVGDDEQALESAINKFMDEKLAHSILVSSDFWTLTLRDDVGGARMIPIDSQKNRIVKHIIPDYVPLDVSDPQDLHKFFSGAGIVHVEMMIDGEKWHYHYLSDDEFQIYHDENLPTFYVVPGSAADTPESEIRCEQCGAKIESWFSKCSVCGFTSGSGYGSSPGYSEACGVWE